MPYCPKCGNNIDEEMKFCPKCGAALMDEQTQPKTPTQTGSVTYHSRNEKGEKNEKHEKNEKAEKREKHEHPYIGSIIGGLVLIFIGALFYLQSSGFFKYGGEEVWAFIFATIGVLIIAGALYGAIIAGRRNPRVS